jgi:hypothetical protein
LPVCWVACAHQHRADGIKTYVLEAIATGAYNSHVGTRKEL